METKTVLVTGIGGNVGQGVLRNIRDLNYTIYLIGTDIASFTAGNHLCDITYQVPYSYDASYITTIAEIVDKHNVDLILPTTDYEVYYLSLHKDKINAEIAVSEPATAKIYLKLYFFILNNYSFLKTSPKYIPFRLNNFDNNFNNNWNNYTNGLSKV